MTATAIHTLGDFYVPAYRVLLDDEELPANVLRDVMSVTYRDSVDEIDSFDLMVNNWDADRRAFKYVGVPDELTSSVFAPGRRISVHLGYGNELEKMLVGTITQVDADFPESGAPTVRVAGKNELHDFRREQHVWSWRDTKDSDIAIEIGRNPVRRDRPGIDFRVVAPNAGDEDASDFVFMSNEYDIVFLLRLARRRGYTLALRGEGDDRHLYFGPQESDEAGEVELELTWGKSLLSFKPELSTGNQVEEVTVRGVDRRTARAIVGRATRASLGLNTDQSDASRAVRGRREVFHRPVRSQREADGLATAILTANAQGMIVGRGATVGIPSLRSGVKLAIGGLGPRFSGRYFTTSTTHTIGGSGYRTEFAARREAPLEESA